MALLTPNATYTMNGVKVSEKIIPDGTRWKSASKAVAAGFSANDLYKKNAKLSGGTGKAKSVTIHNTNDLANVHDDAEQYTRATYNENMNSSRVHFYVDDTGAWQNLKAGTGLTPADPEGSAEVSWHSGDGSIPDGGNMTSISFEIIMRQDSVADAKAYDNGARMAAWMLWKHGLGIDKLVTHTYWVNKAAGKSFADVDKQCTNLISGKKWCPSYIFNSYNATTAYNNWMKFKNTVKGYLDALNGAKNESTTTKPTTNTTTTTTPTTNKTTLRFKKGDVVMFTGNKHYSNANATSGPSCKPGKAKVSATPNANYKHPYHLIAVSGGGSNVYGWVDAADVVAIEEEKPTTNTTQTETKPTTNTTTTTTPSNNITFKKGDVVMFTGNKHYSYANAASGPSCKPGKATITAGPYSNYKHPYHLIAVSGGRSNVYGWVDAKDIKSIEAAETTPVKDYEAAARDVIKGKYGNGAARRANLKAAGFTDAEATKIQGIVNELLK